VPQLIDDTPSHDTTSHPIQLEVYKAGRPDLRLLVVILTYDGSVEQQAFAASVEREVGGWVVVMMCSLEVHDMCLFEGSALPRGVHHTMAMVCTVTQSVFADLSQTRPANPCADA
jgi:hypothetical protein